MIKRMLSLLMPALLCSCATINYMDIETYNPSEVTFPEGVGRMLVVNNALPQPSGVGYTYSFMGVKQDTARAVVDSALFATCHGLGGGMVEADFFNDVRLYHHPTRTDGQYLDALKLTPEQVDSLCQATGTDGIISLDRLIFNMHKEVLAFAGGYLMGDIKVIMTGTVRCYLPNRPNPLATVLLNDSVEWNESAGTREVLNELLPDATTALRIAGQYMGAKAYVNFVPHWQKETRWYFSGADSRWKEASAYTSGQKWDKALERWTQLYEATNGWKSKAKAASNLALCYEMKGQLSQAHEWATRSYGLFKDNLSDADGTTRLLLLYTESLTNRIRLDKKLNMQFGND